MPQTAILVFMFNYSTALVLTSHLYVSQVAVIIILSIKISPFQKQGKAGLKITADAQMMFKKNLKNRNIHIPVPSNTQITIWENIFCSIFISLFGNGLHLQKHQNFDTLF